MGLFDFLSGTKRPASDTPAASADEVIAALLAINRDSAPFRVFRINDETSDLLAEWKIVDARWYEVFAKAGISRVFRIRMKLDEAAHELRAVDEEYAVEWRAGVPTLSRAVSGFRGQKKEISFGGAYGFTEELKPGEIYRYRFNTGEIKSPLQEATLACGWTWRGVAFGKL